MVAEKLASIFFVKNSNDKRGGISWQVLKITSYLGTDSGSRQPKPDEVKMVLYSRGVWNALFSLAVY